MPSLKEICVKTVAKHFDSLIKLSSNDTGRKFVWRFLHPDCQIPSRPTYMILRELGKRKILKREHMALFSKEFVQLDSLSLQHLHLTPSSISVFREFTLHSITAVNVSGISLMDLINSLREETIHNLHSFKVVKMFLGTKSPAIEALGRLQNLIYLNISCTDLDSNDLRELVKSLQLLQYLDISKTMVTDITCLLELKNSLRGLSLHNIKLMNDRLVTQILSTVLQLEKLRVLDVSFLRYGVCPRLPSVTQLIGSTSLPHLQHLEMADNPFGLTINDVTILLENKSKLTFLGFRLDAGEFIHENRAIEELSREFPNIKICGGISEGSFMKMLKYYENRDKFIRCLLSDVDFAIRQGEYFSPDFFKFLVEFLEDIFERSGEMHSMGIYAAWSMIMTGQQLHAIPTELLQRMTHYALSFIEKVPLDTHDRGEEVDIDTSSTIDEENMEIEMDTDESENETADADINETDDSQDSEEDDFVGDYMLPRFYGTARALNFLKIVLHTNRVAIDCIRWCGALFKVIKYVRGPRTRTLALAQLTEIINRMSEIELDEISTSSAYMESLVKSVAELYLHEAHMTSFLEVESEERFSYLHDFWEFIGQNVDILGAVKRLLTNSRQACYNFIRVGGWEVWILILDVIDLQLISSGPLMDLQEILEIVKSQLNG